MTTQQLTEKVKEKLSLIQGIEETIINAATHLMQKEDIKNNYLIPAENNYQLPTVVLCAIFHALAVKNTPNNRNLKKQVKQIKPNVELFADFRLKS